MFLANRSTRNLIAALLLTAALFLTINLVIRPSGLPDGMIWLALILLAGALALYIWDWRADQLTAAVDEDADLDAISLTSAPAAVALPEVASVPAPQPIAQVATPEPVAESTPAPEPDAAPKPLAEKVAAEPEPVTEPAPAAEEHAADALSAADAPEPVVAPEPEPEAPEATQQTVGEHAADGTEPTAQNLAQAADDSHVNSADSERAAEGTEPVVENPAQTVADGDVATVAGEADDLTRIEGIGPYYRDALHKIGVTTFQALSTMQPEKIVAELKSHGYRQHPSIPSWPAQAALAAAGDWQGLAALQATLSGGRKVN